MLVEGGAVEARKPVRIGRKMCRHPIQDNANAGLVRRIDETGEAFRRTEAPGRRE